MDKEAIEVVLKRSFRDSNIQQIIDIEMESALPKGENYTSTIMRIKMKVVLGNGRVAKRTLIMKQGNISETADRYEKDYNLFGMEVSMYLRIFKEMEYLMDEFDDNDDHLWCNLIHCDTSSRSMILEDLKAVGFQLVRRQDGLDLEHALLVLRNLGRFHAMVKILEERGVISKDNYKIYPFFCNEEYIKAFPYGGMRFFGKAIKENWGHEWANVADKMMEIPFAMFMEKINKSVKLLEGNFKCLNHGDCWSNNMMFNYDWKNRPISIRFLDFQIPHYNTPCTDVTYFMNLSIQPAVRRKNHKLLLECYHSSLARSLEKFGYKGIIPSFKDIADAMEHLSFYRFMMIAFLYPIITCDSKNAFDHEVVFQTRGEKGFNMEIYKEAGFMERIGADIAELAHKHLSV